MSNDLADIATLVEKRRGQRELRDPDVRFRSHRPLQYGGRLLEIAAPEQREPEVGQDLRLIRTSCEVTAVVKRGMIEPLRLQQFVTETPLGVDLDWTTR
jgi:hypothetical protein